ncbi:metal-binding protein, partial [Streptomyces purpurogeneiscleroticus]
NPQCQCCDAYADVLQRSGIAVTVKETPALAALKREHGVPDPLQGCHTLLIDGYVVEGHVPVAAVRRLLAERPA